MKIRTLVTGICLSVLLIGLIFYKIYGGIDYPKDSRCSADLQSLGGQIELYKKEQGQYPTTRQGLSALVTKPTDLTDASTWRQYLVSLPIDPWHHPYFYSFPSRRSSDAFDLFSLGPDGIESTDDIYYQNGPRRGSP